jgi:hypothetical protein
MLRRSRYWLCSLWLPICLSANVAAAAPADDCTDKPEVCGRRQFEAGIARYRAGSYSAALEHFVEAQRLKPHPAVLFNLALAEAKLDRQLQAVEHLELVENDPTSSEELIEKARSERVQLERSLSVIEVDVNGPAEVRIDGRLVGQPASQRVTPGRHRVSVRGKRTLEREVELRAGERLLLSFDLAQDAGRDEQPSPQPQTAAHGPSPWWFYGGLGLTAVLGGVTVWSALDTQAAYDDYASALPSLDQRQADQRVEDGHAREVRTNVLIGVTAIAAAGTAVLGAFVVDWGAAERRVSVQVAPGAILASGRF